MTPGQYVEWTIRRARELGVSFAGKPADVAHMIAHDIPVFNDIYFDYDVCGNLLSRPALDSLLHRVTVQKNVSHIFIPRRDRLARPENPLDGMKLELSFLLAGASVVLMDKVTPGLLPGGRFDIGQLITMLLDYDRSGKDRRDLAEKMILTQLALSQLGFSTGGRPPYAFDRHLVDSAGKPVRPLAAGERVRMPGHHVVWLPAEDVRLEIAMRIRRDLFTKSASDIKRELTLEGIPSPDAGRMRKDNGIRHEVSGEWHINTITAIGRNPLFRAVATYGKRSMGDQLRFSRSGPRNLTAEERINTEKVRTVRNSPDEVVSAAAHFPPLCSPEEDARLQEILNDRGSTQRDKPRSKDPKRNPLGCRVFDWCGWPMYREPSYRGGFRYTCSGYRHKKCTYNHVDGAVTTKFAVQTIKQTLFTPAVQSAFQRTLAELNGASPLDEKLEAQLSLLADEQSAATAELETVERNLTRAKTDAQYTVVSK